MKVWLASPTYGHVDPGCVSTIRVAVMSAAKHGTDWVGDLSPDRLGYSDARNFVLERVTECGVETDGVMWVDSDIRPRSDSIQRLLHTAEKYGFDFLTGVYHQRRGGYRPCFHMWDDQADSGRGGFRINLIYELDQIKEIGGSGFGFVYTSMRLIQAIQALPSFDPDRGKWFPDKRWGNVSEDLGFCLKARETGTKLMVDTGIQVGHLGETDVITREVYLQGIQVHGKTPALQVHAR